MSSLPFRLTALALAATGLITAAVSSARGQAPSAPAEQSFIAVLQSDAPAADKAMACKRLAVHGSDAAVPDLARLLNDERLASWARIALEAIPGAAADEALRDAAGALEGKLLIGVVNSIGVRRDADAVELLSGLLKNQDAMVASSAAVALGRIGNNAATAKLREALAGAPHEVKSAVAEGCVLCAERALADGRSADATGIYDQVRTADVPVQRVVEATRGSILARGDEGIPLLIEQLRSADKRLFQIALSTAREMPGNTIDTALAEELPTMAPFRAPLLISAMADRPDTVVLSAIQDAAASGPQPVRMAAIAAIGRVGNVSCLDSLLQIAGGSDPELAQTAKQALAVLPGESVNQKIVDSLGSATGGSYLALIELIGARRIHAVELLLEALNRSDQAVRAAALASLGQTIPSDKLSILIELVKSPRNADDAPAAQQALKTAAVRMPDREDCAAQLAAAVERAPLATQLVLLDILAAVGGTTSLATVHAAANDPQLRDASTRLLGEWMTIDAAPVLLDLAKTGPADRFQVRALRGYIRIARQFVMDDAERVAMCRNALDAATQPAEQKLVLEVLERYPNLETLKLAIEILRRPQLKDDAVRSTLVVAQKTRGHDDEVLVLLGQAGLPKMNVEVVKAEYGAGGSQKDVTDVLQRGVTDQPVLVPPSSTYNDSFGGDPAPNTPKQLRVQYKIDGHPAEATFAENRLIILTLPK
jgi:HEAT repeat protein